MKEVVNVFMRLMVLSARLQGGCISFLSFLIMMNSHPLGEQSSDPCGFTYIRRHNACCTDACFRIIGQGVTRKYKYSI